MIVAKTFKWEAAHRIPWHNGKCKHLHGHSYKMIVEFEGEPDENGFVIDFNIIKEIITPYIKAIDHTTIISSKDTELKEVFDTKKWKYYLLPFDSTAENLCKHFADLIIAEQQTLLKENKITALSIKVFETETSYTYLSVQLS
ncbi:MAG: 6-carboxytetrahydropterin synthase [Chitinophagaceae bacterium]|nr:6-carboxytetrahydropterin synthase [Chitinophagaceae bacterium]MCW5905894.1 6-carboxytetrahydropterin synthase [Chitinophagaceae bacterium]